MTHCRSLLATLLVVAACGDDGGNTNPTPDAPPVVDTCLPTAGEITSYPGTFTGTVLGAGADLTVPDGGCATQTGDQWYDPVSEDVVIRLGGLTAGTTYAVTLTTDEDLSFYVTTACPAMAGAVTGCLNFTDTSFTSEQGTFVAAAAEHFLIVDAPEAPTTGAFTLDIVAAECTADTEATDCAAPTPYCVEFACVECVSSFDCAASAPVCGTESACVASSATCTGDTDDTTSANDGPTIATMIATPTMSTPTVVTGGVCSTPVTEQDWYKVTLAAGDVGIGLAFTGAANDLDVYLLDATGAVVESGQSNAGISEGIRGTDLTAGTYYVVVTQYAPGATTAAVPYTLTVGIPVCDDDFGCTTAAAPICGGAGTCVGGFAECTGDDAADTGSAGGDDGPAAARTLAPTPLVASTATGAVCSSPGREADWYKVTALAGEGLDVTVTWTGADDLDPVILDSTGKTMGLSFYKSPENVKLTYLPAGTYYIQVTKYSQSPAVAATAYTISATRTAVQVCTTATDCAAEYSTQVYRGSCSAGVCQAIAPGARANGMACDSGDDCTNDCSYISFDADAQDSVCTTTCTTTADCGAIGSGLTCTAFSSGNFCVPACTSNLECGANTGSSTLDTGLPWDYLTCTVATGVCAL